ncbi:MAG: GNAT family N-acetyltransferase [Parasporobacterium sp.]|nr:GNAT family N-acetyltransferase [Parasporobacterium sp.]
MEYRIIDGAQNMKLEDIQRLLKMTYWADKRSPETVEKSVRNASCYGIFLEDVNKLVGFARVISDYATTFYLADVIIDPAYQRQGLGTALVSYVLSRPVYQGLRGILLTKNAHGLYRKFGFELNTERAMTR